MFSVEEIAMAPPPDVKFYESGDRLYVQAQRIWLILVGFVMQHPQRASSAPPTISYGDLAKLMGAADGRAGHTLGRQLGIVGEFCLANGLPALNAVVVNQQTRQPGAEVVLQPGNSVLDEQRAVAAYNWYTVRPPTTGTLRQVWETMGDST